MMSPADVIRNRTRYYTHLYAIHGIPLPPDEFLSRANEIHAEALLSYDASRGASFSTYLWHRLGRLKDVAIAQQRHRHRHVVLDEATQCIRTGMDVLAAEDPCLDDLSEDALALVEHLLARGMRKGLRPSPRTVATRIGWELDRTEDAWEEVGVWFAHGGRPVFRAEFTCA